MSKPQHETIQDVLTAAAKDQTAITVILSTGDAISGTAEHLHGEVLTLDEGGRKMHVRTSCVVAIGPREREQHPQG